MEKRTVTLTTNFKCSKLEFVSWSCTTQSLHFLTFFIAIKQLHCLPGSESSLLLLWYPLQSLFKIHNNPCLTITSHPEFNFVTPTLTSSSLSFWKKTNQVRAAFTTKVSQLWNHLYMKSCVNQGNLFPLYTTCSYII